MSADLPQEGFEFTGELVEWRGPAPFYFVRVPEPVADEIAEVAATITYWGCVPVTCTSGGTSWTTALFPREGTYLVPMKDAVRRAESVALGDQVHVVMHLRTGPAKR